MRKMNKYRCKGYNVLNSANEIMTTGAIAKALNYFDEQNYLAEQEIGRLKEENEKLKAEMAEVMKRIRATRIMCSIDKIC